MATAKKAAPKPKKMVAKPKKAAPKGMSMGKMKAC